MEGRQSFEGRVSLIDMREMYDLTDQVPEVVDVPGAGQLEVGAAAVAFRDVDFDYGPDRAILAC